jgi:hypothetical protein
MPSHGAELIASERERQVTEEGWTDQRDDGLRRGDLAQAGVCYALRAVSEIQSSRSAARASRDFWPWGGDWKPGASDDYIRLLTKAGALIAAEIDRSEREQHVRPA